MRECRRFEREGASFLEHLSHCEECRTARKEYEALQRELVSMAPAKHEPPHGWKDRVRRAAKELPERRSWWRELGERIGHGLSVGSGGSRPAPWRGAAIAAAAAAVLALASLGVFRAVSTSAPPALSLEYAVRPGSESLRGEEPQPGDLIDLVGRTGGARFVELRVYFNDTPFLVVPAVDQERVEGVFVVPSVGTYQPLLVVSDSPIPTARSSVDDDAGAVLAAGGRVELGRAIRVR